MSISQIEALLISRAKTRKRLDASYFSLARWHRLGHLRAIILDGRMVAFLKKDVERFARNHGAHRLKPGRKTLAQKTQGAGCRA
jgi:phosphoserine phosphatase